MHVRRPAGGWELLQIAPEVFCARTPLANWYLLRDGRDKVVGGVDIAALEEWIAGVPLREVPQELRYTGS